MKSYQDLSIYQTAFSLAKEVHLLSFKMPKHEIYELGSQVRRSAQSIRANIVEGNGRRKYKADFIKFLVYADGSLLETVSHLNMIVELHSIEGISTSIEKYNQLGKQLNKFIQYVETNWRT
ncbi:MAG: four helix bundle protein [Saccharofermentanaceae bacterium]|jgi:four helix bundle protein